MKVASLSFPEGDRAASHSPDPVTLTVILFRRIGCRQNALQLSPLLHLRVAVGGYIFKKPAFMSNA